MVKTINSAHIRDRAILLTLAFGSLTLPATSQQLDDVVVSAFAEAQSPGNGSLCWTLGETMVEFYSNGDALDQGFLSGFCPVTDVANPAAAGPAENLISVFPNPTAAVLHIRTATAGKYRAELFDAQGRLILAQSFEGAVSELDLSPYTAGMYLLRIYSAENTMKTSIIQKIR